MRFTVYLSPKLLRRLGPESLIDPPVSPVGRSSTTTLPGRVHLTLHLTLHSSPVPTSIPTQKRAPCQTQKLRTDLDTLLSGSPLWTFVDVLFLPRCLSVSLPPTRDLLSPCPNVSPTVSSDVLPTYVVLVRTFHGRTVNLPIPLESFQSPSPLSCPRSTSGISRLKSLQRLHLCRSRLLRDAGLSLLYFPMDPPTTLLSNEETRNPTLSDPAVVGCPDSSRVVSSPTSFFLSYGLLSSFVTPPEPPTSNKGIHFSYVVL